MIGSRVGLNPFRPMSVFKERLFLWSATHRESEAHNRLPTGQRYLRLVYESTLLAKAHVQGIDPWYSASCTKRLAKFLHRQHFVQPYSELPSLKFI